MIPNAQYSPEGKIFLRFYQPVPKLIKVGNLSFNFVVRLGISICLVDEEDVPQLLALQGGCCGRKRQIVALASYEAANLWSTGERGRR
jgi:hypothetical protein